MTQSDRHDDGSIGGLLAGLAGDVQDLVRGELKLARVEVDDKIERIVTAAIWLVGGALVGFAGLVVALQAVAFVLASVMPLWLAYLIVGVLIIGAGALVARVGLAQISLKELVPEKTVDNLQKDARMLKEHT